MKTFFTLLVIVLLVAAGYIFFYDQGKLFSFRNTNGSNNIFSFNGDASSTVGGVVKDLSDKASSTLSDVEKAAQDASFGARQTLLDKVQEAVIAPIEDKFKSLLGLSTPESIQGAVSNIVSFASSTIDQYGGVGYVVHAGDSITFSIKNPFVGLSVNTSYSAAWDGEHIEKGTLTDSSIKILSHSWDQKGEYGVVFDFINGDKTLHQILPVVVY